MSASSQSYPQSCPRTSPPFRPLTITEVEFEPSPVLGKSRIGLYAAAGAVFGVLLGVAIATSPTLPRWLSQAKSAANADRQSRAAIAPHGPRHAGSGAGR